MKCGQLSITLASLCVAVAYAEEPRRKNLLRFQPRLADEKRVLYQQGDICQTMKNEKVPPDNSSCWQWEKYTGDGYNNPQLGCDYQPCQDAVCACDSYCCETAWDHSCRGFATPTEAAPINFFESGCTAHTLCCEPESAGPKPSEVTTSARECISNSDNPEYGNMIRFDDDIKFYYEVIEHNSKPALKARIDYEYIGWLAWGMSTDGHMEGSDAVIAFPDEDPSASNPGRYDMSGVTFEDITKSGGEPLPEASLVQTDTTTTLTFTKYLEQDGDLSIDPNGTNTFLIAAGFFNVFGRHKKKAHFDVDLSKPCIDPALSYYALSDPNHQSSDDKI